MYLQAGHEGRAGGATRPGVAKQLDGRTMQLHREGNAMCPPTTLDRDTHACWIDHGWVISYARVYLFEGVLVA